MIQDPDVCGHKHQTFLYVDIKLSILLRHYYQTLENPDACGHKKQISLYVRRGFLDNKETISKTSCMRTILR